MPPRKDRAQKTVGQEAGRTGLIFTQQGYVDEEMLTSLKGRQAIKVFKEMSENDAIISALLFAIDMLVRQVDWEVEENPDGKKEDAEFLEECMEDMSHSWNDFISEIFSMVVYGFSFFEIVYKLRRGTDSDPHSKFSDGKIGWRKFAFRSQDSLDRWEFDETGGVRGYTQMPPPEYKEITIPIEKGLLFRTTTFKNNPEGRSALRGAYVSWYRKKRMEEIEGVGVERDLAGLPMAEVDAAILDPNAPTELKQIRSQIETVIRDVRRDRSDGILWPLVYDKDGNKLYTFSLLNSGGTRQFDTNAVIGRYDQRICQSVLADFILLGHEKVGSFALSSDKTDLFAVALGAWLDVVEQTINRFAVPRLFELNAISTEHPPTIKHGDIEQPNLQELSTFISTLSGTGMAFFPDPNTEKYLRTLANLPEPAEEAQQEFDQGQLQQLQQLLGEVQGAAQQQGILPGGQEEPSEPEQAPEQ